VRPEGLDKLKTFIHRIGSRTRAHPTCMYGLYLCPYFCKISEMYIAVIFFSAIGVLSVSLVMGNLIAQIFTLLL
jgi:hypothetical protein